ncbi:hypothetical protein N7510_010493 [Penicillium lagena]|uniref:uncharacterized protein n=1 Tax=Penicillium lagena TaxID=94218 RepID=UPI00253FBB7D|nr:uncharacterized protein N7510_010493 [Penicillium lagena]KAJ5605339.1 hypothetical protein N7510_010493 [Penicillium lagena]
MTHHHLQLIPFPTNDPKDPLRWPFGLKIAAIVVTSLHNFVSNMGGSGISVALPLLMEEFHKSQSEATQVLTFNFLFLGIGNIFWVPIAMKFGKRASLLSSMAMQAGMLAWSAATTSFDSLVVARCLLGFAAAAGESIVPEIVADTTFVHQRGAMMSIYVVLISGGSAVGPLIAGFMTTLTADTWRSFLWLCCGLAIFNLILIFFLFPESNFSRPELDLTTNQLETLQNRTRFKEGKPEEEFCEDTKSVRSASDDYTIYTPSAREILPPVSYDRDVNLLKAMIDPLKLLVHPSVLWGIFTYTITLSPQVILIFTMSPLLLAPPYLFSTESVGLMQIAAMIGFVVACYGGGGLSDVITGYIVRHSSSQKIWPEQRLISLIPGMAFGPAGCILLAFACDNQLHWSAIAVGFGLLSFGSVYTPNIAITYIVHRHQRDAAKSLVLINVFKNLITFIFLYVAVDWANKSGYVQVYMIMFMLNVLVLIFAVPLYFFDAKKRRNVEDY